ncbi:MAG: FMN adenylyltransferase [Alistipes sp.]|nr:FMN adenylyltransferase [Alistipes sp.]
MEPLRIEGVVAHGRRLGRQLGFPTANLRVDEEIAAEDGVYASWAEVDGVRYRAMSNLGCNPSVGGRERRLETHLFGFEGSLYGRRLSVVLWRKVRDERCFASVEELRVQIAADKEYIAKLR